MDVSLELGAVRGFVIFWLRVSEGCDAVRQSERLNGSGIGRSPNDVERRATPHAESLTVQV